MTSYALCVFHCTKCIFRVPHTWLGKKSRNKQNRQSPGTCMPLLEEHWGVLSISAQQHSGLHLILHSAQPWGAPALLPRLGRTSTESCRSVFMRPQGAGSHQPSRLGVWWVLSTHHRAQALCIALVCNGSNSFSSQNVHPVCVCGLVGGMG